MSALFSPLTIKDITFRNRIGVSPMWQYSSVEGVANGQADIALMARQMMRNPYWPLQAAQELGVDAKQHVATQVSFFVG